MGVGAVGVGGAGGGEIGRKWAAETAGGTRVGSNSSRAQNW